MVETKFILTAIISAAIALAGLACFQQSNSHEAKMKELQIIHDCTKR